MNATTTPRPRTALVLKRITRCEWGTDLSLGFIAEPLDRVQVLKTIAFSPRGRQHTCRTDSGETFVASDEMVQLDGGAR